MEAQPKKNLKEGRLKRKRSGHGETRQEEGGRGDRNEGVKRKRLDAMSVGYFRRVNERLSDGFTEDEERSLFVENVLLEVKGKATLVAMDMTGSVTLQKLLPLASLTQVGEVLAELGGETGCEFKPVSCDRCGGHVMESALRQMSRWTEEDQTGNTEEETQGEDNGMLEAQVLLLSGVVRENFTEFLRHTHGSHVVRTLIHVLGGCLGPERSDNHSGRKSTTLLTDFEAPDSFWMELKHVFGCLMENMKICVTDAVAGLVLQTMLTVCHSKRPKLCKQLNKGIIGYITSLSSAPGVSPLLVFLKDQASSRLIETVIQLSHKALLRDLYKNHLRGQLVSLALHPIANFPVQKLISASAHLKIFLKVFDELNDGVEAILAAGHMGVIIQLVDSCAQREERQGVMLQRLLEAFHCAKPASRHLSCLPLFLSLLAYEVYYNTETAEGDTVTQRPLGSICYHGSCLVQTLAKFKDRSILMNSLHSLTPADLLTMGTDQFGSHALQSLVTLASDKGKGKILRKLEGQYVQLACSKYGSRLLEAIWNSAPVSQRQNIAQELVPSETQLRSDQFARHVWAKFALAHFVRRRAQWQEIQSGESKKRKMFSDILD
ncbi:nucleolar protein 9 [Chanos chanos]|uniref:Nucleolar protein 9 n=1 Tax=Chanos chanos TaxID=29144 RepID=A0A6J2VGX1_CHACN|nr:nucleolar protein 9 [Chanos chanos]